MISAACSRGSVAAMEALEYDSKCLGPRALQLLGVASWSGGFRQFYEQVLATFRELGIKPTWLAAEGPELSGDLTRFGTGRKPG